MIVAAFDIAGKASGAAYGDAGGQPRFKTLRQELDGDDLGPIGAGFRWWMVGIIQDCKPTHIAFEAPWVPSGGREGSRNTGTRIPRLLIGLAFLAESIAAEFGIDCSEAAPQTVRRHFVGHGRPDDPKETVMARCRQLGWPIRNDHEGDAGALWSYTQSLLDPKFSYRTTPLLARAGA